MLPLLETKFCLKAFKMLPLDPDLSVALRSGGWWNLIVIQWLSCKRESIVIPRTCPLFGLAPSIKPLFLICFHYLAVLSLKNWMAENSDKHLFYSTLHLASGVSLLHMSLGEEDQVKVNDTLLSWLIPVAAGHWMKLRSCPSSLNLPYDLDLPPHRMMTASKDQHPVKKIWAGAVLPFMT